MRTAGPRERGIALLLVLWIFMVLGVIALDFSHYIRDEAMASVNFSDETRGYYVALAGMNRALYDAVQDREANPGGGKTPATPPPGQTKSNKMKKHLGTDEDAEERIPADGVWHPGEFVGARYEVRMSDEGALISVNITDKLLLESLLKSVVTYLVQGGSSTKGVDRRAATDIDTVVDSIIDYEDCDSLKRAHGNERGAKNAWFDAPEELLQIQGMTADLFYGSNGMPGLRDLVTVYGSRKGLINCQTVTAPVLQVLLKLEPDAAADLVADRDSDGENFCKRIEGMAEAIDPALGLLLQPGAPTTVRVEARADIAEERNRSWVGAIVALEAGNAEGPRVRRWLDRTWDGRLPSPPESSGPLS